MRQITSELAWRNPAVCIRVPGPYKGFSTRPSAFGFLAHIRVSPTPADTLRVPTAAPEGAASDVAPEEAVSFGM